MSHIFLLLLLLTFETAALEEIKVRPGQDVTLHCRGPRGVNITLLEWSIPEIKSDGYVFFYRNRRSYENYQHELFKGRVELRDPSMKNCDVSVILKDVSVNDTGIYECRIITSDLSSGKRVQNESRKAISLTVTDSGFKDDDKEKRGVKDTYLLVTVSVIAAVFLCFLVLVAVLIYRKCKSSKHSEHEHYQRKSVKELI